MKRVLLALVFCAFATCADASTCFWVGGTGTWSTTNTANWASSSGGTAGTCAATGGVPKQAADTATFDAAATGLNGGTVTVDSTISGVTLVSVVADAMVGTLDFSVNNPTITVTNGFTSNGSGVRSIKLGSSVINMSGTSATFGFTTTTNLTFTAGTSQINFTSSTANGARSFNGGGQTYATISVAGATGTTNPELAFAGSNTIATLTLAGGTWVRFSSGTTQTITTLNVNGSGYNSAAVMDGGSGGSATFSSANNATLNWAVLLGIHFTGAGTFSCANCIDGQGNSGIAISGPSGGGGGHIIGG